MRDRALLALYERISGPVTTISGGKKSPVHFMLEIVIIYFIKKLLSSQFLKTLSNFAEFTIVFSTQ